MAEAEETNLEALKEHFANLGEKLDRIIGHVGYRQLPDYVEDITLSSQYQGPVKLRGYRYLYMLVSADAVTAMGSSNLMTLDIGGGVTYLQQLKPGWNVIDAPREFRYRVVGLSGNPPALLVHTNDLKAMDGVVSYSGGGVGGSAGNPSYTELTGSLAPLATVGPTSVSLPASDFNTTSLVVAGQYGVFHRNAHTRYVIVTNNLSVSISLYLVPFDDLGTASVPVGLMQDASNTYTVAAGNAAQFAYNSVPTMNAPLNSFYLGITPAATGATGTIDVAWIENI